jgi:hypothetical protein
MYKLFNSKIIAFLVLIIFSTPVDVWALQSHGAPEGNYVHQMAHLLFMGSLLYLYWHTRHTPALASRGWRYLQIFCIIFTFWNILAFIGHETFGYLTSDDFIEKNGLKESIAGPISIAKVIYFVTKMDHLLYVPALLALVVSLRTFYHDALKEEER